MKVETNKRLILYATDLFGTTNAKTAEGVVRFGTSPIVAVVDRKQVGKTVQDVIGVGGDVPIVATVKEAIDMGAEAMLLGCAFTGGQMPEQWRADIIEALDAGLDVINGLHDFLVNDPEYVALAEKKGCKLIDLRRPPDHLPVASGKAAKVDCLTVLAVGTDCSVGKMTVSIEIERLAKKKGYKTGFVATGQTGIMIAGTGIAVDRVIGDFMAGAIEELVVEAAPGLDLLFVEGQGSVSHPGFSGVTLSLLHGCAPEAMILCHQAGRTQIGKTGFPIADYNDLIEMYEKLAAIIRPAKVIGVALNTFGLPDAEARRYIEEAAKITGLPATDPVRYGAEPLLEPLEKLLKSRKANHEKVGSAK